MSSKSYSTWKAPSFDDDDESGEIDVGIEELPKSKEQVLHEELLRSLAQQQEQLHQLQPSNNNNFVFTAGVSTQHPQRIFLRPSQPAIQEPMEAPKPTPLQPMPTTNEEQLRKMMQQEMDRILQQYQSQIAALRPPVPTQEGKQEAIPKPTPSPAAPLLHPVEVPYSKPMVTVPQGLATAVVQARAVQQSALFRDRRLCSTHGCPNKSRTGGLCGSCLNIKDRKQRKAITQQRKDEEYDTKRLKKLAEWQYFELERRQRHVRNRREAVALVTQELDGLRPTEAALNQEEEQVEFQMTELFSRCSRT